MQECNKVVWLLEKMVKLYGKTSSPQCFFSYVCVLNVLNRYTNCSLTKYMEKHKVKPDSKAFHLVSFHIKHQINWTST